MSGYNTIQEVYDFFAEKISDYAKDISSMKIKS